MKTRGIRDRETVLAPMLLLPVVLYIVLFVGFPFIMSFVFSLSNVTVGNPNFHFVESAAESAGLQRITSGAIIMAGSGMCDAGRIRAHLKDNLYSSANTVLLVGYQAPGTLGSLLLQGARSVRIHGEEIRVAARIRMLDIYSGHADRRALARWVDLPGASVVRHVPRQGAG